MKGEHNKGDEKQNLFLAYLTIHLQIFTSLYDLQKQLSAADLEVFLLKMYFELFQFLQLH